jgi:hypothetical protein
MTSLASFRPANAGDNEVESESAINPTTSVKRKTSTAKDKQAAATAAPIEVESDSIAVASKTKGAKRQKKITETMKTLESKDA